MSTVTALFDRFEDARDAMRDLEASGFSRDHITLLAPQHVLESQPVKGERTASGAAVGAGLGLLAGLAAVTVPGVGVVLAAGPAVAGAILGAVGGGLVGSLIEAGVPAEHAERYAAAVHGGGILLAVRVSPQDAPRAGEVLRRRHPSRLDEGSQSNDAI